MKIAAFAAAATIAATTAVSAAEIGATGISIGAELDTYYDIDGENFNSVLSPELGYSAWGAKFTASTDLNLVTADEITVTDMFDAPVFSLGAEYGLGMGATVYGEVDVDTDLETSGARAGISFKF